MGAGSNPERKYLPVPFGGVWDESSTPAKVGGNGLTACQNLVYRRFGAWGKRSGSGLAYTSAAATPTPSTTVGAFRWYRGYPAPLTQLVIIANNGLYTGGDPTSAGSQPLTLAAPFTTLSATTPSFAPVRDPAILPSNASTGGADVLVITGITGQFGFAIGQIVVAGTPAAGQVVTATLTNGATTVTTAPYTVLSTDNRASVALALVAAINLSYAVSQLGGPTNRPFLSASEILTLPNSPNPRVQVAALVSGTAGNAITFFATVTGGAGVTLTPSAATGISGGGAQTSAPVKWDGVTLSGLSPYITNSFTGCVSWHNHVWFWGDPLNPDTLYATDLDQPEGWNFMSQNGGYDIGQGDGNPFVQAAVPIGNLLYVFKSASIYAITGYDFQSGEYQFNVQLAIAGHGVPAKECVARLENALIFWDGHGFRRLQVGAFDLEPLGGTILLTAGRVAQGNQNLMRAIAGSFLVNAALTDTYNVPVGFASEIHSRIVLFAVDTGSGAADTVLVYDDEASSTLGSPAWSRWTGWNVSAWVQFGAGAPALGYSAAEPPVLFWIPPQAIAPLTVMQYGRNPADDSGAAISWLAQTGWVDCGTYALSKHLHRIFLGIEAIPGVTIALTISPSVAATLALGAPIEYPARPITFPITPGVAAIEQGQVLLVTVNPFLRANAYLFTFTEAGSQTSFELASMTLDYVEEPFLS
ncbi:MAG: hypothetical protein NVS1B2_15770 [Vulcanimicrobiaceae bacterium]